jgi:hypothetical protein
MELKSRVGVASKAQKQVRAELLAAGATWWLARSARAALMALRLSGVEFRRPWKAPEPRPREGPFDGTEKRLPQHPAIAKKQREASRRGLERRARALEARTRNDDAGPTASEAASA